MVGFLFLLYVLLLFSGGLHSQASGLHVGQSWTIWARLTTGCRGRRDGGPEEVAGQSGKKGCGGKGGWNSIHCPRWLGLWEFRSPLDKGGQAGVGSKAAPWVWLNWLDSSACTGKVMAWEVTKREWLPPLLEVKMALCYDYFSCFVLLQVSHFWIQWPEQMSKWRRGSPPPPPPPPLPDMRGHIKLLLRKESVLL